METAEETAEEKYFRLQRAYWLQVAETEGFDLEHVVVPPSMIGRINGLIAYDCERYVDHYPHRMLVKHYANVGLHRYNMLKRTNFHLGSLKKFNMLQNFVSSYYMTLLAHDPRSCPSGKDFQVRVDERTYGSLDLTVSVARPKDELVTTKMPFIPHFHGGASAAGIFIGDLPDWPSDDDLKDQNRFYLVKEADLQYNNWILMYLELVIC
ncbi:PREDICTED: UPF0725 protein At1g23960-like [Camelina sativa]|uniref:UPF0725 protein At1g23960-like n=1 Tax=Camelina sativa TaxID=90675 RepID=A0ABM0YCE9_CAMSA|nr:PREDICTED: UPF0725 protein At1g23960-like [Camelina sativa]